MPMNNRILRPLARPLLLDAVPGAAAAYSLRQLSNSYTGPVVTVRRSSDNAEEDFKASEIDDGTLTAFCGAGDGFVKTWFDQSGNTGRDASQGTAANQPKIVSSGSLVTEGGKAAIELDGVDDYFSSNITGFQSIQNLTVAIVFSSSLAAAADSQTATLWGFGDAATRALLVGPSTGFLSGEYLTLSLRDTDSRRLGSSTYRRNANQLSMLFSTHLQSGTAFFSDGLQVDLDLTFSMTTSTSAAPSNTGFTANDNVTLGAVINGGSPALFTQHKFQELLYYPSDQTANRQRIEGDINRHFGIF
jgi:hypothetical protein